MRFSYSEKYGTEKTSYSYTAHAMWNNKNEPRKLAETPKNQNVMKKKGVKMVWPWQESQSVPSVWKLTNNLAFETLRSNIH